MKKIIFVSIISFSLNIEYTTTQEKAPPTYWENYMSFKIGNYFEYSINNGFMRYYRKFVGDTIVQSNGKHYYKIEKYRPGFGTSYLFERIDSMGIWYQLFTAPQECFLYKFNIPIGDSFIYYCSINHMKLTDTFSINNIIGSNGYYKIRKFYLNAPSAPQDDFIAQKFQLIYQYNYEGGNIVQLVGAMIDSITYGNIYLGISQTENIIINNSQLLQNYPNPFNASTIIGFKLTEKSYIKITLYDVSGREVKVLKNEFLNRGEYKIKLNAENLSSGIYCYVLYTNKEKISKKLVIIK